MKNSIKLSFLLILINFGWLTTVCANTITPAPPPSLCEEVGDQICCFIGSPAEICYDNPNNPVDTLPPPNTTVDVGTVTYIHTDALGSPVAASDAAGQALWTEHYWPYGEKREKSPEASSIDIGYTGHRDDDATGLTYMGARYYDPIAGRFMGVDPAGFSEDNIFSFNRYAYGNNNPYKYIDPNGKNAVTAFGGLLYETGQLLTGNGFDGAMVLGALADGYNGEGSGFWSSATQDVLTFGGGALVGGATKLYRMAQASRASIISATRGASAGAMKLVSYGGNAARKLRKHSQHMRETARKMGIEIPKGPGKPATRVAMEDFITKIVAEGNTVTGRYMTFAEAQWSRLGDAIVVRQMNGEFITFLDATKKGVATTAPAGL